MAINDVHQQNINYEVLTQIKREYEKPTPKFNGLG